MLTAPIPLVPSAIGAGIALTVLITWLVRRHRNVHRRLDRILKSIGAGQLRDIVIPDGLDGHIHIDRLVLTGQGAMVVEFKNVAGTVFAGERLDEWAILDKRGRHPLRNPLSGLQDRIIAVRALSPELPVDGRVVFADASEFPKGRPDKVCLLKELAAQPAVADAVSHSEAWAELTQRVESVRVPAAPLQM